MPQLSGRELASSATLSVVWCATERTPGCPSACLWHAAAAGPRSQQQASTGGFAPFLGALFVLSIVLLGVFWVTGVMNPPPTATNNPAATRQTVAQNQPTPTGETFTARPTKTRSQATAAAPLATATTIPPTEPPAAQSINGQTIDFPGVYGEGKLRGTVTEVKETQIIPPASGSQGATARGKFVLVSMTVTNMGTESIKTHTDGLKLKDSTGRVFDITGDFDAWYTAVKAVGAATYQDSLQPGLPTPMLFVFDTAADASGYYLVPGK